MNEVIKKPNKPSRKCKMINKEIKILCYCYIDDAVLTAENKNDHNDEKQYNMIISTEGIKCENLY